MAEAAAWLVANIDLIPVDGLVLDVASGSGRNAVFLAQRGWRVHAVDRDADALAHLERVGQGLPTAGSGTGARVTVQCLDLESDSVSFGAGRYQAAIVFNYLHRPLMPAIVEAIALGGVLIYETLTVDQAQRGRPRNPAFLLRPGELPTLVRPLRVLRSREGDFDGKFVASIVAMR